MHATRPAHAGPDARWVAWLVVAAIAFHCAVFVARAANPLVISDAWYFVDAFVRKSMDGTLTLGDFFAKRSSVDHSLPFHKLVMLVNARWFGLDLSLDAWLGFAFALAGVVLFRHVVARSSGEAFARWPVQLAWVAAAGVYMSLNASSIFEWPMLTLSYATMFFSFCLFVACRRAVEDGRWGAVVAWAAVVLLALDNGGVIMVLAALLASTLLALRTGQARRGLALVVGLVGAIVAYKLGYALLAPAPDAATPRAFAGALAQLDLPGLVLGLRVPLTFGVVHGEHAQALFRGAAGAVYWAIAAIAVAGHAWFWWQAWKGRPTPAWHLAIAIMLVFYGLTAGVLIGRAGQYGTALFNQPRYVVFFQLHVVALCLMAATWQAERLRDAGTASMRRIRLPWGLVAAACAGLLLLQVPLDKQAWKRQPFQRRYVERLAAQMDEMAATPAVAPPQCLPLLTVCRMPVATRVRAVDFLKEHRLNLFSDEFRRRHDFAPAK